MVMDAQLDPLIIQPGAGKELRAFGNVLSVLLSGEYTNGTLSVMSEVTPPGGGPPLHVHSHEDEIFLVSEGWISYFETFYACCAEEFARAEGPRQDRIMAIHQEYGIDLLALRVETKKLR